MFDHLFFVDAGPLPLGVLLVLSSAYPETCPWQVVWHRFFGIVCLAFGVFWTSSIGFVFGLESISQRLSCGRFISP